MFNVPRAGVRIAEGAGFVSVELLFLPSGYTPCPVCRRHTIHDKTLEIHVSSTKTSPRSDLTVDRRMSSFAEEPASRAFGRCLLQAVWGTCRLGHGDRSYRRRARHNASKLAGEFATCPALAGPHFIFWMSRRRLHPADVTHVDDAANGLWTPAARSSCRADMQVARQATGSSTSGRCGGGRTGGGVVRIGFAIKNPPDRKRVARTVLVFGGG